MWLTTAHDEKENVVGVEKISGLAIGNVSLWNQSQRHFIIHHQSLSMPIHFPPAFFNFGVLLFVALRMPHNAMLPSLTHPSNPIAHSHPQ